jgi:hypothetical protein
MWATSKQSRTWLAVGDYYAKGNRSLRACAKPTSRSDPSIGASWELAQASLFRPAALQALSRYPERGSVVNTTNPEKPQPRKTGVALLASEPQADVVTPESFTDPSALAFPDLDSSAAEIVEQQSVIAS